MVDEFSSFARMPKPVFREENFFDLVRQAIFLQEVAHPAIRFAAEGGHEGSDLCCDRRQIGQAVTNILKNAVEAIEARQQIEPGYSGAVTATVFRQEPYLVLTLDDNGIGLPADRDRIVEPYMTTREKGTGLGLAIVKKIVEEHYGELSFEPNDQGGTRVTIRMDTVLLQAGALQDAVGDLRRVRRVVRVGVFVCSEAGFYEQPRVANGASELLVSVFGERGKHARAAVGSIALPLGAPVEVEMTVEVE